jgi:hypothetical protein
LEKRDKGRFVELRWGFIIFSQLPFDKRGFLDFFALRRPFGKAQDRLGAKKYLEVVLSNSSKGRI